MLLYRARSSSTALLGRSLMLVTVQAEVCPTMA